MAACGFESLSANEVGVCVSLVLLFSTRRGLEIGHFTVQSALPNIYEYKQRFRNQKKEALGRNGLSVIHTYRQTFTGNGLQAAHISFTDRSKYKRLRNTKQNHARK